MRSGLMVALFLAALVRSFSEARTVSRCELKKELGKLLVLPRELERLKEKILTRVICRLERETQLNTELLQVLEQSPAWSSAGSPTHRRRRDVEFFEEDMRKLQEEVEAQKQEEDRSLEALEDRSSSDTNVIDKLDQDEVGPEDDTSLTFEELSLKDQEVKSGGEDALRLEKDMRDTEEEVERRVVDLLDRDEVDAAEETDNRKDTAVIFEELEKLVVTNTVEEEGRKLEEDMSAAEGEVEKRLINKLDQDEVDTSEGENTEDSHLRAGPRVIDEQHRDKTEVDLSEAEEGTQAETSRLSPEDEERVLINSMDRDDTAEDTREEAGQDETNPEVDASEDHKGMTMTNMEGDKMNVVPGDTEKDMGWEDGDEMDTSSMKGGRTNLTFVEMVSILVEKMKAGEDRAKLEDEDVKYERDPEVDMSDVKKVLEEVERRVVSEDQTNPRKETPEGENEARHREEELMRHLDQEEDMAGELEDGDQTNAGQHLSKEEKSSSAKDEDEKTLDRLDQDQRSPVEDRDMAIEEVVRRLIKDGRSSVEDTSSTEDVNKRWILGELRRIISKLDREQREDAPRDKRDTSGEMGLVSEHRVKVATDGGEIGSMADQDPLEDADAEAGELEKMFTTRQDDSDTLADMDLDHVAGPAEEDETSGGRRKRLLGLLQLPDHLTCDSGSGRSRNVCNANCSAFVDDDIADDLACFVRIKAWTSLLRPMCPADRDFFQDCP